MIATMTNSGAQAVRTPAGTAFAQLPPADKPAPTLLLFASEGMETLAVEPYCLVGQLLHARGWNVVSLDLPCHGADRRAGEPTELEGWAARTAASEDFVAAFQAQVNDVVGYLIQSGAADPARITVAGTSRGGFMAFHSAARNPQICAVVGFAPVTDLRALNEFSGQENNPLTERLALVNTVEPLRGRAAWITIGNADTRVDTGKAEAFAHALVSDRSAQNLGNDITLRVVPAPGHTSLPEWHEDAADWLTVRSLPGSKRPNISFVSK